MQFAIYQLPFDESDCKLGRGNLVNDYHKVIEASDFIDLCFEALTYSGLNSGTREKVKNFLKWFVVKGFYDQATHLCSRGLIVSYCINGWRHASGTKLNGSPMLVLL